MRRVTHAGPLPGGRRVALGHSGAHRTISRWLADPDLDTIVLLDAGYGDLNAYGTWLGARAGRRMIDVGDLTMPWTDAFHDTLPATMVIERFPASDKVLAPHVRDAAIVYVRSHLGHMALVTGGVAIPVVLRALDAPTT